MDIEAQILLHVLFSVIKNLLTRYKLAIGDVFETDVKNYGTHS
jgi:hypothetical protein